MRSDEINAICKRIEQIKAEIEESSSEQYKDVLRFKLAYLERRLGF